MAIIGTFWDRNLASRAGDALSGVTQGSIAHSLPATSPQVIFFTMRSVQAIGHQPAVVGMAIRGNQSLNTVGYAVSSTASCPTIEYEVTSAILHSIIA